MSNRHYLKVKNKDINKVVAEYQILGNNDYFDEEFYKNLEINIDEDGVIEPAKINYLDFLYEWDKWLDRNPEKKGFPKISETVKNQEDIKILKECIFLHYQVCQTYEQQLFDKTKTLYPKYINRNGESKKRYEILLECY